MNVIGTHEGQVNGHVTMRALMASSKGLKTQFTKICELLSTTHPV